jgi:hypothetical protein
VVEILSVLTASVWVRAGVESREKTSVGPEQLQLGPGLFAEESQVCERCEYLLGISVLCLPHDKLIVRPSPQKMKAMVPGDPLSTTTWVGIKRNQDFQELEASKATSLKKSKERKETNMKANGPALAGSWTGRGPSSLLVAMGIVGGGKHLT